MKRKNSSSRLIDTEMVISYVLRTGVIGCAVIISFGVLLTWINPYALGHFSNEVLPALTSGQIVPDGEIPRSWSQLFSGLLGLNPVTVIASGLFLLILLPITRVGLTVVLFILESDLIYSMITAFVLTVLLSSLYFGKGL